jgi:hypothetical protein
METRSSDEEGHIALKEVRMAFNRHIPAPRRCAAIRSLRELAVAEAVITPSRTIAMTGETRIVLILILLQVERTRKGCVEFYCSEAGSQSPYVGRNW